MHNHWPGCSGSGKGLVTIQLYHDLHVLATFEDKFVFKKLDGPQICGSLVTLFCLKFSLNASVLVFSQQWRKLTYLTSLVISSSVLYLYLNCK